MNNQIQISDEQLLENAEQILDEIGLDIKTIINMTLKRIVREKNIAFLLPDNLDSNNQQHNEKGDTMINEKDSYIKMTKSKAIYMFRNTGIIFTNNITFSSKNKSTSVYWANPNFDVIEKNWYLILNDTIHSQIHLFVIPAKSIKPFDLVYRADSPNLIDLQIMYGDPSYTDMRSKISFVKYYVKSLDY